MKKNTVKTLQMAAIVFGCVTALLVIAVSVLPRVVDTGPVKMQMTKTILELTGREVVFAGNLHWRLFPSLRIAAERVRIKNPPGFDEPAWLSMARGEAAVEIWPLMFGKIVLGRISLHGVRLHLIRTADGRTNWLFRDAPSEAEKVPQGGGVGSGEARDADRKTGFQFDSVEEIELTDAAVVWEDRLTGRRFNSENIRLAVDPFRWGHSTGLDLQLPFHAPDVRYRGALELKTRVNAAPNLAAVEFADTEITLTLTESPLKRQVEPAVLTVPEIGFEREADTVHVPQMLLRCGSLAVSARIDAWQVTTLPKADARLAVAEADPREVLAQFGISVPKRRDPKAFSQFAADTAVHADANSLVFGGLQLRLDDTLIRGDVKFDLAPKPSVRFDLSGDTVDVSRYLAADAKKPPVVSPAAALAAALSKLPAEALGRLDADGTLHFKRLQFDGAYADDLLLRLSAKEGVVRSRQQAAGLYRGDYAGSVDWKAENNRTVVALNERLEHADPEAILKVIGSKIHLSGDLSAAAALQGQAKEPGKIRQAMNGRWSFALKDGAIGEPEFLRILYRGIPLLKLEPLPGIEHEGLAFDEISGTGDWGGSLIRSEDLLVDTPRFRIDGRGSTRTDTGALDYRLTVRLVKSRADENGAATFHGTPLVVAVTGTLDAPHYRLDSAASLTERNKAKIEKLLDKNQNKIDALKQKLNKKLGPEVGDLLKKPL